MRLQALRGMFTDDECRARVRSARVATVPEAAIAALDEAIRAVEHALGSNRETAKLLAPRQIMLARKALEDGNSVVV